MPSGLLTQKYPKGVVAAAPFGVLTPYARAADHARRLPPRARRAQIEKLLDTWKAEVLAAARKHPAKSYRLGQAQVEAFAKLLAGIPRASGSGPIGHGRMPPLRHELATRTDRVGGR